MANEQNSAQWRYDAWIDKMLASHPDIIIWRKTSLPKLIHAPNGDTRHVLEEELLRTIIYVDCVKQCLANIDLTEVTFTTSHPQGSILGNFFNALDLICPVRHERMWHNFLRLIHILLDANLPLSKEDAKSLMYHISYGIHEFKVQISASLRNKFHRLAIRICNKLPACSETMHNMFFFICEIRMPLVDVRPIFHGVVQWQRKCHIFWIFAENIRGTKDEVTQFL